MMISDSGVIQEPPPQVNSLKLKVKQSTTLL